MGAVLIVVYGLYLLAVGARGNAPTFLTAIETERTFAYWVIVLLIVGALWETETGERIAKPLAALIVVGFILRAGNWQMLAANARALMQGTG